MGYPAAVSYTHLYLMRLHNLTNIVLSEIMCCAESTISGYRTGRRVPDIFVICHLSTISVSYTHLDTVAKAYCLSKEHHSEETEDD